MINKKSWNKWLLLSDEKGKELRKMLVSFEYLLILVRVF